MRLCDAHKVQDMIAHTDAFASIGITLQPDRETYTAVQAARIPTDEILVVFDIPETGVDMVSFFREFSNVLNDGLTHGCKEREAIEMNPGITGVARKLWERMFLMKHL